MFLPDTGDSIDLNVERYFRFYLEGRVTSRRKSVNKISTKVIFYIIYLTVL